MKAIKLKASERKILGRKVKALRREGLVPANVFGREVKSLAIQIPEKDLQEAYEKAGETTIVELEVGGKTRHSLISNVQVHPVTGEILHVDFMQVDLKKKVSAQVPLEFVGESPAEKSAIGVVIQQMNEVEVEALPMDLPDKIEVDISKLENVDDAILVKNLKVDREKVKIEEDGEQIVVNVSAPQAEEPEPAPKEEVEGETSEAPEGEASAEPESPEPSSAE